MRSPEEVAREVLGCHLIDTDGGPGLPDYVCETTGHEQWDCAVEEGRLAALIRARDAEVRAEELAVFRVVYTLAWDGEPSMSGEPHRMSAGELCLADARRSLDFVGRRKDNPRIEGRMVGPWEPMP